MVENSEPNQKAAPTSESINVDAVLFARPVIRDPNTMEPVSPPSQPEQPGDFLLLQSTRKSAIADALLLCFLMFAFEMFIQTIIAIWVGIPPDVPEEWIESYMTQVERSLLMPFLTARAIAAIFFIWAILRHRQQRIITIGLGRSNLRLNVVIGIAATPMVAGVVLLTMIFLSIIIPNLIEQMEENADRIMGMVPVLHPVYAAFFSVMIAVYEELIFRGFLLSRVRRWTQSWVWAVVITTAIFTVLHAFDQTLPALVAVTILSLSFSILTIWRRSIIPAIIAHTLWDWSQFIFLYLDSGEV